LIVPINRACTPGPAATFPVVVTGGQAPMHPLIFAQLSLLVRSRVNAYTVKPRLFTRIVPTLVLRSCSFAPPPLAVARVAASIVAAAVAAIRLRMRLTGNLQIFVGIASTRRSREAEASRNAPPAKAPPPQASASFGTRWRRR